MSIKVISRNKEGNPVTVIRTALSDVYWAMAQAAQRATLEPIGNGVYKFKQEDPVKVTIKEFHVKQQ